MCVTPADTSTSPTLKDVKMSSTSNNQPKGSSSLGEEHIPKIRKTYTITKQRERWTEEEHNMFLEALKLHGRAWRRIEEHIGTKTAVQIRSHAQKFFSKVVRESSGNNTSSVKPIVIPPPRPKRKPMHPYPRKFGNTSSKDLPNLQKPERSISSIQSVSEYETRSPTSVLTTIGSDTMGSSASHIAKHCRSLDSYTTSSSPTGLSLTEQENMCQSHPSSIEEGNGSPRSGSTSPTMTTEGKSDMELEVALVDAPVTSLKLFGRTVLITDTSKPNSQVVMKETQCLESLPSTGKEETPEEMEKDMQSSTLIQSENVTQQDSSVVSGQGAWNPWSCGIPQLFYCLPLQRAQLNAAQNTTAAPPPWWPFCSGLPFPLMHLPNSGPNKHPSEPDMEIPDSDNKHPSAEKEPAEEQQPKLDESVPPTNPKPTSEKQVKGFVPYKRCSAERESMQTEISEDRDRQRIRLCL